ncbi:DUF6067 family protein, partial [candidate division NPL-UPA2 bacterium]|nr:DUF6067 family protein [candidate division NPL-UPA2 bacterium]
FPVEAEEYVLSVWARGKGRLGLRFCFLEQCPRDPRRRVHILTTPGGGDFDVDSEQWEKFEVGFKPFRKGDPEYHLRRGDEWRAIPAYGGSMPATLTHVSFYLEVYGGTISLDDVHFGPVPREEPEPVKGLEPGHLPLLTLPYLETPPLVDGHFEEGEWSGAAAITGFQMLGGGLSKRQTKVYVGYDKESLYFAFVSSQEGKFGFGPKGGHDVHPTAAAEGIEIWLQPPGRGFFQFYGMPFGGIFDQSQEKGKAWDGAWNFENSVDLVAEMVGGILTTRERIWTAEVSIAFSELGVNPPEDGEQWRMNFCRNFSVGADEFREGEDWTTWSPLRASFREPERFAFAYFNSQAPAIQIEQLGELEAAGFDIQGSVSSGRYSQFTVEAVLQRGDDRRQPIIEYRLPVSVSPGQPAPFTIAENWKVSRTTPMNLLLGVRCASEGQLLTRLEIPFTSWAELRTHLALVYVDGYVSVELDATGVGGLPEQGIAEIAILGTEVSETVELNKGTPKRRLRLDISTLAAGEHPVKASLRDAQGQLIASSTEIVRIPERPEWLGNKIGISEEPPPPWVPLEVQGQTVFIPQREYRLGNSGLPSQIINLGKDILSEPATFRIVINGRELPWEFAPLKKIAQTKNEAKWTVAGQAGPVRLDGTLTVEFDGFSFLQFRVWSEKPVRVEALWMEFPLRKDFTLYARGRRLAPSPPLFTFASLHETLPGAEFFRIGCRKWGSWEYNPGWKWTNDFFNDIWVGDDRRGFSVMTESAQFIRGEKYVDFVSGGESKHMTVSLISEPTALEGEWPYEFAWMTTPARPEPSDPELWRPAFFMHPVDTRDPVYPEEYLRGIYAGIQYGITKHVSHPEIYDPERLKRILDISQYYDFKFVPNAHPAAASVIAPEFTYFGAEWEAIPRFGWQSVHGQEVRVTCYRSSHTDFKLWTVRAWVEEHGMDGTYIDSGTAGCMNPYHGCGWVDEDGTRHPVPALWATRDFYKRLYTYLESQGGVIFSHTLQETLVSGFLHTAVCGEEWHLEKEHLYRRLCPDMFRVWFMRNQYGTPFTWFAAQHFDWRTWMRQEYRVPLREVLAMGLLHRVLPALGDVLEGARFLPALWEITDQWWTTSEFIPYWSPEAPVRTNAEGVFASTYFKPEERRALVVVSNWNFEPCEEHVHLHPCWVKAKDMHQPVPSAHRSREVQLSFNWERLGLKGEDVRITELHWFVPGARKGDELVPVGNRINFKLPGRDFKLLLIEPR